jgi:hypothetical protein
MSNLGTPMLYTCLVNGRDMKRNYIPFVMITRMIGNNTALQYK